MNRIPPWLLAVASMLSVQLSSALAVGLWRPAWVRPLARRLTPFRWFLALGLVGFHGWLYLFSPWQFALTAPWTQFLTALVAARLLGWLFRPADEHPFGWDELALAFSLWQLGKRRGVSTEKGVSTA